MDTLLVSALERGPKPRRRIWALAANDNHGRKITVSFKPATTITIAEIEVFGSLLEQIETAHLNDNQKDGKEHDA
jgi:hypothetical protein